MDQGIRTHDLLPAARAAQVRPGMTLVELLVVVAISAVLLASSIPLLRSTIQENKIRESARVLNVLINSAKSRAVEDGRPAGLWIERTAPGSNAAINIFLAETPLPYAGDVAGATTLMLTDSDGNGVVESAQFELRTASLMSTLVYRYDRIRFESKGAWYIIRQNPVVQPSATPPTVSFWFAHPDTRFSVGADNEWGKANTDDDLDGLTDNDTEAGWPGTDDIWDSPTQGPQPPASQPIQGSRYQIWRRPVKTGASPLDLPAGGILDLAWSGVGPRGVQFAAASATDADPVVILFSPYGSIDRVLTAGRDVAVNGAVHLLAGRGDRLEPADNFPPDSPNPIPYDSSMNPPMVTYDKNLASFDSLWVSIGHRTGSVTTAENAWVLTAPAGGPPDAYTFWDTIRATRQFAQAAQSMGGN